MSWERLQIVGHVGSAEAKQSQSTTGQWFTRISVAVDRHGTDGNFTTIWYRVIVVCSSKEKAEAAVTRYKPGRLVLANGRPFNELRKKRDTGEPYIDSGMLSDGWPELLDRKPTN